MATKRKAGAKVAKKSTRKTAKKAARKAVKKSAAKKAAKRPAPKKAATKKRAPSPAFMRPVRPDDVLARIIGATPMPRTEVTRKLWAYIKRNSLQDAFNRRFINANDELRPVFGGRNRVDMFEMTRLLNQHLSHGVGGGH